MHCAPTGLLVEAVVGDAHRNPADGGDDLALPDDPVTDGPRLEALPGNPHGSGDLRPDLLVGMGRHIQFHRLLVGGEDAQHRGRAQVGGGEVRDAVQRPSGPL